MKKYFPSSELIINEDGSVFHLHVKPEQLADKVILVGDPGRVALVASHFENKEFDDGLLCMEAHHLDSAASSTSQPTRKITVPPLSPSDTPSGVSAPSRKLPPRPARGFSPRRQQWPFQSRAPDRLWKFALELS